MLLLQPGEFRIWTPTAGEAMLLYLGPAHGSVVTPAVTLRGPLFSGRALVDTQTVTKLCDVGKRTDFPYLECIASTPSSIS